MLKFISTFYYLLSTYVAKKSITIGFLLFRTRSSKSSTLWTVKIFCRFVVVEMCRWARNCPNDGMTTDVVNLCPINLGNIVIVLCFFFFAYLFAKRLNLIRNNFQVDGSYDFTNCASMKTQTNNNFFSVVQQSDTHTRNLLFKISFCAF